MCLDGPGFNPQSGHLFCLTPLSIPHPALALEPSLTTSTNTTSSAATLPSTDPYADIVKISDKIFRILLRLLIFVVF